MNRLLETLSLQPDLSRALRATLAFSLTLLGCFMMGEPVAAQFAATTAMGVSLPQLRGAYRIRVVVLGVKIAVIILAAWAGSLASSHLAAAVVCMGVVALLSGWWRHLSADYGPALGIDSALLFLLALEGPNHGATPTQIVTWTALGAAGAAVLQLGGWFFRPQHAVRHGIAECWVAVSDLFLALRPEAKPDLPAQRQRELRETLDRATATLKAATRPDTPLMKHLDLMRHEAAHVAMQVMAFHTASEPLRQQPAFARQAPAWETLMLELANLARSVAITLITHRPENLAVTEARLKTCTHLVKVLDGQLAGMGLGTPSLESMCGLLCQLPAELETVRTILDKTVDASARRTVFALRLPDLSGYSMGAVATWLNPSPHVDAVLVRYAIRMAVLTMLAVAAYKTWAIPRGYWMAFAIIVVLQPDYGATRQRALQRVSGTIGGAVLGSALLGCWLPTWLIGVLAVATAFGFTYFLKRRYGWAVFFVTIMVVLITELHIPVHLDFTIGRVLSNLAGAALALIAALFFWPSWERKKFPVVLAHAIRANRDYLEAVSRPLMAGGPFNSEVIWAKQKAERAGNIANASLQRLIAEPQRDVKRSAQSSALVACNDRVTRAISVLATQLNARQRELMTDSERIMNELIHTLEQVASSAETDTFESIPSPVIGVNHSCAPMLDPLRVEVQALSLAMMD